jgi:hypothetical protein
MSAAAFKNMIRRVEFEDGGKKLALRRQFNERVRAARQLTGGQKSPKRKKRKKTVRKKSRKKQKTVNASEIKTIERILRAIDKDGDEEEEYFGTRLTLVGWGTLRELLEDGPRGDGMRIFGVEYEVEKLTVGDVKSVLNDGAEILVVKPGSVKVSTLTRDDEMLRGEEAWRYGGRLGNFDYEDYDDDADLVGSYRQRWIKVNKKFLKYLQEFMKWVKIHHMK